jgi:hypothetical protein
VGDHDPALQHHLFDVAEAEREPVVQPDTVTDDLRRKTENPLYDGAPVPTSPAPSMLYPTNLPIIPATAAAQVDGAVSAADHQLLRLRHPSLITAFPLTVT